MSTWLKLLPLEIQGITDLIEPTEEIREGETVAGVVSDDLKKIWTLYKSIKKSADLLEVELRYTKASAQEYGKIVELMTKAKALEIIFWIGAEDELQLWSRPGQTDLRAGWRVVKFKQPESPFKFLFGNQP